MPTSAPSSTTVPNEIGMPVYLMYQSIVRSVNSASVNALIPGIFRMRCTTSAAGTPSFGFTRTNERSLRCGGAYSSARSYVV